MTSSFKREAQQKQSLVIKNQEISDKYSERVDQIAALQETKELLSKQILDLTEATQRAQRET